MKKIFIILCLLLINNLVSSQDYCKFIEDVEDYHSKVRLNSKSDSINSNTFNLNSYLSIFSSLHKDNNLEYCYTYYNSGLDGQPILYVKDEQFDIDTYVEAKMLQAKDEIEEKAIRNSLNKKNPTEVIEQKRKMQAWISDNYRKAYSAEYKLGPTYTMKNHLTPEQSKIGFFQYLYFNEMGESFAGHWHTVERNVICTYEEFDKMRDSYVYNSEKEENLSPIVLLEKSKCIITWYEYVEMSGIYRRVYEISREKPYDIKRIESKLFASEIDDGIIY
jgi:hypothetical protein